LLSAARAFLADVGTAVARILSTGRQSRKRGGDGGLDRGAAGPADAPVFAAATAGFDAASKLLAAQAKAYLANPTAGVLASFSRRWCLSTAGQRRVLSAARIANHTSQQHVLNAVNS